ncbi:MAG: two-component sensor histidine kinase [Desulfobacteraceae bacterium 4484_190.2]|nr:MAG: two-component sensor histidine kinase [Desulfobacteraceae bacterium 4484_190.2]
MGSLKPKFWDYQDITSGPARRMFNFRRMWKLAFFLTTGVALVPLISMAMLDYKVTQDAIESEILLRTSRLVSNTQRTISYFMAERRSALDLVVHENTFEILTDHAHLSKIIQDLKETFGGFVDLGVIDPLGNQRNYIGPYSLLGKDYSNQAWFKEVVAHGVYISDVFLGFRHIPHMVIAVKHELSNGFFYVLRATLDTEKFNDMFSNLEIAGRGDAFIINYEGILQTPSRLHGNVLEKLSLPIPEPAPKTRVLEWKSADEVSLIIGYRYIAGTPFILMVVKQKEELMKPWYTTRMEVIGFLVISIIIILLVILSGATYLVNRVYLADQTRIMTLHEVEYSNKMASIGRLASGVAHEINNPLAIINEKAGLIKDLLTFKKDYTKDPRLIGLVDSVLSSVERCGRITKRLLGFARHMDVSIQSTKLDEIIHDVLGFLYKEAEYRSIEVSVKIPNDIPQLETDRGKLQQIFLNLINNAFAAMSDGGHLNITARREDKDFVSATITDNGCGIPDEDLERIFEPFFSTKTKKGGTGLGLSITYGLVKDVGGTISVQSEVEKGTSFTITLPLKMEQKEGSKT